MNDQAIEDGFQQQHSMKHSVFTLLDFSKAYDTVWREKLLLHILNTGIPPTFIRWIQSFLKDCRGHVQLFNVFSSSRRFTQGLPQGSVLTSLLFLFYINDLVSTLTMMQLLPSLLMTSLSSLQLRKRKMLKLLPSQ